MRIPEKFLGVGAVAVIIGALACGGDTRLPSPITVNVVKIEKEIANFNFQTHRLLQLIELANRDYIKV